MLLYRGNSHVKKSAPIRRCRLPEYLIVEALMDTYQEWAFYLHPDDYLARYPTCVGWIGLREAIKLHPYTTFAMMIKDPEPYYELQLQVHNVYIERVRADPKKYLHIPSEVLLMFIGTEEINVKYR